MTVYFNHGLLEPVIVTRLYYPKGRTVTLMSGMPDFEFDREEKHDLHEAWVFMEKHLKTLILETDLNTSRINNPDQ